MKRLISFLFAQADTLFNWSFGQRGNPLSHLGSLGWYFFWIVAGSGIYLYIFFDTGVTDAYASVEYMTNDQWYAAGVMRSLHRYASDALVIIALLHMLREFALDRMRGKRFFAWITGIATLGFVYACGITGYWLVWDQLAQMIAISRAVWQRMLAPSVQLQLAMEIHRACQPVWSRQQCTQNAARHPPRFFRVLARRRRP